uniref:Cytochrome P450 n=1 Tax=Mucochytrium quahogii TaxID=96639 RepID=A0A7S2W3Q7_9STRA|mmetsp:Transcript_1714/g.2586  ORF Transcript_1714/g.2586 Transcript_1714/m.2586 type:complete len:492 (+) Transcript_1714:153-1628(+)|eukprot:CAMPEP_0203747930 /NCGR_PEP_ID=MMETSP0098-20131031/2942_1 /ASSEMBLY_ACC=CAM_ASM_000208 /TAXON_ID=96639 /ORGANISM=" , Strain NY0313808BC1" /LENGTH=491 /DNA_ID=CAMNT_0050636515 /DNA_START=942 /DNA_END=2417 /DNA_ORIENTATION=-
MDRIDRLSKHLQSGGCALDAAGSSCPFGGAKVKPLAVSAMFSEEEIKQAVPPPQVKSTARTSSDPVNFLMECAQEFPEIFVLDRGNGYKYAVLSDVNMFEDILTYDEEFGNPVTPNMSVNKNIFQIPVEQLERHEQNAIGGLRQYLLNNNAQLADIIAGKLITYMRQVLGESGEMDLRDLGAAIFWPMTEALFGDRANINDAPYLLEAFENIDNFFGKALKGRKVPAVEQGVSKAYSLFSSMVKEAKQGKGKIGPVIEYYDKVTNREDPDLTAKFATAAWWGGQGNTLPSTVWTFGMVLANPEAKRKAYAEVDGPFANQPDKDGHYNYDTLEYLTASLKETLRMKTYSIAWRQAQNDAVLTSRSGKKYLLPKGMLIGLHFAMRHFDPTVHDEPNKFRPERFLGSGAGLSPTINGKPYAWVPFSAGRHKCSGYSLAMLEIPVVMALVFREYNMELLDPLPGMDYRQAFGVVGPDDKPVRVKYTRRPFNTGST